MKKSRNSTKRSKGSSMQFRMSCWLAAIPTTSVVSEKIVRGTSARVLNNQIETLEINGNTVSVLGITLFGNERIAQLQAEQLAESSADLRILLAHQPDEIRLIESTPVDLFGFRTHPRGTDRPPPSLALLSPHRTYRDMWQPEGCMNCTEHRCTCLPVWGASAEPPPR